ncbi:MerR family transcriptional regulator [Candidatus Hepatincolaceae symbiont of Richtersius coronifer]
MTDINPNLSEPKKDLYTIGEVSKLLALDQHVIRFWSLKFSNYIKPLRKAGQRRYYSNKDLDLLKSIKDLLHVRGLSIKGVHLLLKEKQELKASENILFTSEIKNSIATHNSYDPQIKNALIKRLETIHYNISKLLNS